MRCVIRFALAGMMIVVITATKSAQAAFGPLDLVRNSTSAVLQDNFESPPVGNAPDNGALAGTWFTNATNGSIVQTWSGSQTPFVPAEDGSQYVNLYRPVDAFTTLTGVFSSSITSGTMDARYKLYVPTGGTGDPGEGDTITFDQNGNQYTIAFLVDTTGFVKRYNGAAYVATTVPYVQGVWQNWTINADLTSDTYTLTVGNFSEAGLPFNFVNGGNGTFSQILFAPAGQPVQMLVDQVPEPASVALIGAVGMIPLMRRRAARSR